MNDKDIKSLSIFGFIAFFLKECSLKSDIALKVSTLILHFVCNVLLQNQDDFRSFCRPKRHSCNFWSICCCTNLWRSMISNGTTGVTYDWNDPSSLGSNCFPKCSENLLSSKKTDSAGQNEEEDGIIVTFFLKGNTIYEVWISAKIT